MPGKVGVKIKAGRNLPIMDRGSDTTDAYVEIKLGSVTHKTDVCRKSLNPQWNTDWFRFEVDDAELQDEPLQIRLMDYDTYSANDAIGKVNISLNPLCLDSSGQTTYGKGTVLSGWIPVFDTMHGIRGEVNVIVKVDLFSDVNKFRQSSCGIPFFHSQCIPYGYRAQVIHGFVEELVVNDDPEYQWIDKIRTPRASNEARQVVFLKLSGQVQRKIGLKAINMGANAVIGYTQCFDLEGDVGVVARGIGTAVTLIKDTTSLPTATDITLIEEQTLKYLEFLTGGNINLSQQPSYQVDICKGQSLLNLELKHIYEMNNTEIMQNLIRQEDERGEQPIAKKNLKHQMRRFKHSTRNVFNEKYTALIKKLNDNNRNVQCKSKSKSLNNLLSGLNMKDLHDSAGNESFVLSIREENYNPKSNISKKPSLKRSTPLITRSMSSDSALKLTTIALNSPPIIEFQENTRSSPNIYVDESFLVTTINGVNLKDQKNCNVLNDNLLKVGSHQVKNTQSEYNTLERERVEKIIRMCSVNEDEKISQNWIKPGQRSSLDSLPEAINRHSLLHDLKMFSQHVQEFIHLPKKPNEREKDSVSLLVPLGHCSTGILPYVISGKPASNQSTRTNFYSSQPEVLIDSDNCLKSNQLELPERRLSHSLSFTNFTSTSSKFVEPLKAKYSPLIKICSSACNPSDKSNISVTSTLASALLNTTLKPLLQTNDFISNKFPLFENNSMILNPEMSKKQSDNPDMLKESMNLSNNHYNSNPSLIPLPLPTINPSTSLININQIPYHNTHHHHRSINEINVINTGSNSAMANATTDSPSLKRYASPASAAIVAAAASGHNAAINSSALVQNSTLTGTTAVPSDSQLKLTPLTIKIGSEAQHSDSSLALANTIDSESQLSESVSSTTTTSTTSTMVAKDIGEICRRSSDSDLSVTPKGNSLCVASERLVAATALMRLNQSTKNANTDTMDMLEYPFLTMTMYPPGFILHLGATVAARSVKLLERVSNPDEPEIRDSWWTELRMEIRSHARALGCNVVLGYSESTTISDDVCVLSATGTAAIINMAQNRSVSQNEIYPMTMSNLSKNGGVATMSASLEEKDICKDSRNGLNENCPKEFTSAASTMTPYNNSNSSVKKPGQPPVINVTKNICSLCHIPYNLNSVPFNAKMKKCSICQKGRVPDVLLATLEVPEYIQVTGRGCFMQAQVVRAKKDLRSELNAKEISDGLPFLEYELHRVLINKLKAKGMNAIFGLKAQVAIGERMIALIATGTALFLSALPVPQVPKIVAGNSWTDKQKLNELQKKLYETYERNQEIYQLKCVDPDLLPGSDKQSDTDESDDELVELDLNCGNKDTCVLEVDDIEDLEIISLLMEPYPPEGFHVVNTQIVPGMVDIESIKNLQMFTQVWRAKLDVGQNNNGFPKHFQRLLQTIYFKLRTMIPCAICDLRFRLDLPESDHIQLLVTGMALGLGDANKFKYRHKPLHPNTLSDVGITNNITNSKDLNGCSNQLGNKRTLQEEDYIFPLDEDEMVETPTPITNIPPYGAHSFKLRKMSPSRTTTKANAGIRNRYFPLRDRYGVDITPLCFIPGGKIEKYLGNLNFFFIRESTSIRENGGISGFVHNFITELLAVVRAHIAALGGNCMVSFYMTELILVDNQHKNQGQCLISIGGDAVYVTHYTDD